MIEILLTNILILFFSKKFNATSTFLHEMHVKDGCINKGKNILTY